MRSVEWSGVSGVDSPGSVLGSPELNVLSSARRARTSTTGYSFNGPVVRNRV